MSHLIVVGYTYLGDTLPGRNQWFHLVATSTGSSQRIWIGEARPTFCSLHFLGLNNSLTHTLKQMPVFYFIIITLNRWKARDQQLEWLHGAQNRGTLPGAQDWRHWPYQQQHGWLHGPGQDHQKPGFRPSKFWVLLLAPSLGFLCGF